MIKNSILLVILIGFCVCADIDITKGPPESGKPSVPAHGWFGHSLHNAWKQSHEDLVKLSQDFKDKIKVAFIGDSLIQGWNREGSDLWNRFYTNISAHNYGIAGDSTRQILWRIQNGEINGLKTKLIVLMIGTNNLYNDYNKGTDEEIGEAIKLIIDDIKTKLKQTHILLLGILPRYDAEGIFLPRINNINNIISKLNKTHSDSVHYLNIGPQFHETNGRVKSHLYLSDLFHLSHEGYNVWHNSIQNLINDEIID